MKSILAYKQFTGRLADPIIRQNELALALQAYGKTKEQIREVYDAESNRIFTEQSEKLELLFRHYKISADTRPEIRWMTLAYALACDLVPGMQVLKHAPPKRGRPAKWKEGPTALRLTAIVESIKHERKKGIRDAVRVAIQRYPTEWSGINADSLVARYYDAVKIVSEYEARLEGVLK